MFHARLLEDVLDRVEKGVLARIDDLPDPSVDKELRTRQARRNRHIRRRPVDGVAVLGRLADRILLGMDAQALVEMLAALRLARATRAPALEAVPDAVGSSVLARRKDVAVADDYRADMATRAVRTRCDDVRQLHEVFIPARTRIFDLLRH